MTAEQWPGVVGATPGDVQEHDAEVVVLHFGDLDHQAGVGGGGASPSGVVEVRPEGWVERWADRPIFDHTVEEWRRLARWRARAASHHAGWVVTHAHVLVWRQVVPTGRGLAAMTRATRAWQQKAARRAELDAMETRDKAEGIWAKHHEPGVKRRFWVLIVLAGLTAVAGLVGYLLHGWGPIIAGVGLVLLLADVVGHRLRDPDDEPDYTPPPMPVLISDPDVPLSQLQGQILKVLEREGFILPAPGVPGSIGVAAPLTYEPVRLEYRMVLSSLDEIQPKHLRAIERGLGAEEMTARLLSTGIATNRLLAIRQGDPYAEVPTPSWIETGSRSITDPADLGASVGEVPFTLKFAGIHAIVVGRTGSGKTKGALWSIIDRLSACRDVVLWGCDLMNSPHLARWEGVLQRTAYTPEDAAELLQAAIGEIHRRMAVLKENFDADEWHSGLGPALVLVLDEFAVMASYNGEKGKLNLLVDVETILRMGRKVWVTVILGTQKAGNSDLGSTLVESQVGIKMLLACRERDTVTLLGTDKRDGGWAPHTLTPADEDTEAVNDAGKLYLDSPKHRTPDVYRVWTPLTGRDVRVRVERRLADGLPSLTGGSVSGDTVDAVEIPEGLAFIRQRFAAAGDPDELGAAAICSASGWSQARLAEALEPFGVRPTKVGPRDARVNGYRLAGVERAIEGLG